MLSHWFNEGIFNWPSSARGDSKESYIGWNATATQATRFFPHTATQATRGDEVLLTLPPPIDHLSVKLPESELKMSENATGRN